MTSIALIPPLRCSRCAGRGWVGGLEEAAAGIWPRACVTCAGRGAISVGRIAKEAGADRRTIRRLDERGVIRGKAAARILGALDRLGLLGC